MAPQPRNVGGGQATQTGNAFQDFLMQQMTGQGNSGAQQQLQQLQAFANSPGAQHANQGAIQADIRRLQAQVGQPNQQTSAFQNAFNTQLGGGVPDPSGANAAIRNGIQNGQNQFTNPYQNQQYQQTNFSQLPTNQFQNQTGGADLSGIGRSADTNFNTGQGIGSMGTSGMDSFLSQIMKQGQGMLGPGSGGGVSAQSVGPGIALDPATQFDMNNPYFAALKSEQDRGMKNALAENNARFGAQGAGAIGSGAQFSNSNLQATGNAQNTIALQQALQGLQQQDLAERTARAQTGLGSRGQDVNLAGINSNAALQSQGQGFGNQQNILGQLLGAGGQMRGQDFANQQANRGFDISQLGLGLNQAQGNQQNQTQQRGQDLTSMLQNQSMRNQFGFDAAGMNNNNMQTNNQNQFANNSAQNQFNLNNAQNFAGNQQQTNGMNQQGYQNLLNMGQQNNQMSNGNIQQMLAQLFGGYQQATGLGTPQAQTVMQPSGWGQAIGAISGIAGKLPWGSMFNQTQQQPASVNTALNHAQGLGVQQTGSLMGGMGQPGGGGAMYNSSGGSPIPQGMGGGGGAMYNSNGGSPLNNFPVSMMSPQSGGGPTPMNSGQTGGMQQYDNGQAGSFPVSQMSPQIMQLLQGMQRPGQSIQLPPMFANSYG